MQNYLEIIQDIKSEYSLPCLERIGLTNKEVLLELANQIPQYHGDDFSDFSDIYHNRFLTFVFR